MASALWRTIVGLLTNGALGKGGTWGGPECLAAISLDTHIKESAVWVALSIIVMLTTNMFQDIKTIVRDLKNKKLEMNKIPSWQRKVEVTVGVIHLLLYASLLYYKLNLSSMINMLQPCHVILLLQGLSLLSEGWFGVLVPLYMLPSSTGTLLAMLFPETGGLDQPFEIEEYWIQHYFIQIVPIYLFARRNYMLYDYFRFRTAVHGLAILAVLHFGLYEVVDLLTHVNVEFMLCPTSAMVDIFGLFPEWLVTPSYRTPLTVAVCIVGVTICYTYIALVAGVRMIAPPRKPKDL